MSTENLHPRIDEAQKLVNSSKTQKLPSCEALSTLT